MKRIGMRTIKTLISIFICLMIFIAFKGICVLFDADKDYAFLWYNPFFAAIATAYSIYPNRQKSIEQAKNRCIASIIGGFVAILLVTGYEFIYSSINNLEFGNYWPTLTSDINDQIIPYILVAIFSTLVVVIGNIIKKPGAIFVGILTFLSITVNANASIAIEIGEWGFGLNRIMSTLIGVLVALAVNEFRLPRFHKNKDLLFAVGIDGILYSETDRIKGYINYKLNAMHNIDVNTTLFTSRTPVTFMHLLEDVEINHPVICMSGAALYDAKELKYIKLETISESDSSLLDEYLKEINVTPFKNYIVDNLLHVYCEHIDNEGERMYMDGKKNAPYCNFYLGQNKTDIQDPVYYMIVEKVEVANQILNTINTDESFNNKFFAQVFDVFDNTGCVEGLKYVKIFNKKVLELNIVKEYCKENNFRLVGLSSTDLANHLIDNSYIAVSSYEYDKENLIKVKRFDDMAKKISSIYHNKKYQVESQVDINE